MNTIIDSVQQEDLKRASPVRSERAYIRACMRIYDGPAESRSELCSSIVTMVQASEKPETRARMSALQHDELLTQSEILEAHHSQDL